MPTSWDPPRTRIARRPAGWRVATWQHHVDGDDAVAPRYLAQSGPFASRGRAILAAIEHQDYWGGSICLYPDP